MLEAYLITTIISWIGHAGIAFSFYKKMKEMGYEINPPKESFAETAKRRLFNFIKVCLPVYNIVNTVLIITTQKSLFNKVIEEFSKTGLIYMPESKSQNIVDNSNDNGYVYRPTRYIINGKEITTDDILKMYSKTLTEENLYSRESYSYTNEKQHSYRRPFYTNSNNKK